MTAKPDPSSMIDGDTIEIHGTRIRFFGIDAPESDQFCRDEESELYRCGQKASNALSDFINRRPVECVEVDRDRYNRTVAVCTVGSTNRRALGTPKRMEQVASYRADEVY